MANIQHFNIPAFAVANPQDPTEAEINAWADGLSAVVAALDNIITFFMLPTPAIPPPVQVAPGANLAARLAHVQVLNTYVGQITLFQGLVLAEARTITAHPPPRPTIKVQRPTFDGRPEKTRGFHAVLATYRHLRAADFPDDETFIAWALLCMEGPLVNPWRNALLNRRAILLAQGHPLPLLFNDWGTFLAEFQGKFLDPNEIDNSRRALMALRQTASAREYMQEFDRFAELAGLTGQDFLQNQFRRNLKNAIQEKLLRQPFTDLQHLQIAAIKWDNTLTQFKRQTRGQEQSRQVPQAQQAQPVQTNGTPMDLDFTTLTPEESKQMRAEGLCFRCGQKGHIGQTQMGFQED